MKKMNQKLMLAAILLLCFAPSSFAKHPDRYTDRCDPKRDRRCKQVPEGGSAAIYLLGAGITCLGGMVVRSRSLSAN